MVATWGSNAILSTYFFAFTIFFSPPCAQNCHSWPLRSVDVLGPSRTHQHVRTSFSEVAQRGTPQPVTMSAVRITIMGVGGVGKSALTQRVVNKKFVAKVSLRASRVDRSRPFQRPPLSDDCGRRSHFSPPLPCVSCQP